LPHFAFAEAHFAEDGVVRGGVLKGCLGAGADQPLLPLAAWVQPACDAERRDLPGNRAGPEGEGDGHGRFGKDGHKTWRRAGTETMEGGRGLDLAPAGWIGGIDRGDAEASADEIVTPLQAGRTLKSERFQLKSVADERLGDLAEGWV